MFRTSTLYFQCIYRCAECIDDLRAFAGGSLLGTGTVRTRTCTGYGTRMYGTEPYRISLEDKEFTGRVTAKLVRVTAV